MNVKRLWIFLLLLTLPGPCLAAARPTMKMAELAFYTGADRQQILEEGARREGKLTFYTSGSSDLVSPILEAFQKKYPFIKVDMWRGSGSDVASRPLEEAKAGRDIVDVIEGTQVTMIVLQRMGLVQPFVSPHFAQIEDEAKTTVSGSVVAVAYRSSGIGFGYNTKLVSKDQLPKTYEDLLNPKWNGKLAIAGTDTGIGWMGAIKHSSGGEELLKKIAAQNYPVQMISAVALVQIIATGEYAASPTLIDANVYMSKLKGAPVDWAPLEPVRVNLGKIVVAKKAQNPYAAMLFTDFEISKDVGEIIHVRSYGSFRKDVPPVGQRYKKYFGADTTEEIMAEEAMFKRLFITK